MGSFKVNLELREEKHKIAINNYFLVEPPVSESISSMFPDASPESISSQHLEFFYAVLHATLDACIETRYSVFDAHTAATCCHGVALLAICLLQDITASKAIKIKKELEEKISNQEDLNGQLKIPGALMWLCRLYILHMVKAADLKRGYITDYVKLKNFFSLSNRFFSQLTKSLQKHIANIVAARYQFYLEGLPKNATAHGQPVHLWGQYVSFPHTRLSSNGIVYVSNLFSMRVTLSYLSFNCCYVSLINDVIDENDIPQYRYVSIFLGDGKGGFRFITSSKSDFYFDALIEKTPVFVLGGVAYLEDVDEDTFFSNMQAWESRLLELVLACDIWYPQFPLVAGDPVFNNAPIVPREFCLQSTLDYWSNVKGVRAEDSSLCCLAHIYPASLKEVLHELQQEKRLLPWSFLPTSKRLPFSLEKQPIERSL